MRYLLVYLVAVGLVQGAEIIDGVAAVVNDKVITYSEVREYVQPVAAQLRRSYSGAELLEKVRAAHLDALNNLIERYLILQEFKEKGYSFPETVVDEQMNDIIANDFGGDRAAFIKTLQAENMTLAKYREQLRDRIIIQAMRNRRAQQEIVVSPAKVEQYYQEHLDDFKEEDQIKLRMILIKRNKDEALPAPTLELKTNETAAAAPPPVDVRRKMAEEILAKLDTGDSFESLAKIYSEGREAQKGGEWGWVKRDELRKELSDTAFALRAGQHSRVIETPDGYYLLQVEEIKTARHRPLSEVRDEIEKILLQQQRAKMQADWVKELRAKAYIKMY
jgi:parvulin-like peptidyl-prolyl isomerase